MRCTGRPRPIRDDGFTRCMTRSSAGTSCNGRGLRCARTRAHRVSTRPPWPTLRNTGLTGSWMSWPTTFAIGVWRPLPARRVFIQKPGTAEKRPLSIPVVRDRIVQAAIKIVLEPIFEADFMPCSYGFRPKRSAHDALQVLIDQSWQGKRWVVETDIANCFEAIPFDKLIQAVSERVSDQGVLRLVRVMLRAWGWGMTQILLSPSHLGLVRLDGTVIPPRPFRDWRG